MKMNWKVRFANLAFWGKVAVAIIVPMLAGVGLVWEDMTSWGALGGVVLAAIKNPVTVVAIVLSVYNAAIDPTTPGIGDSERALNYIKPGELPEHIKE